MHIEFYGYDWTGYFEGAGPTATLELDLSKYASLEEAVAAARRLYREADIEMIVCADMAALKAYFE